ncbi:hypothetical protein [Demequina litorisediminis]|uniref:IPT/TIG domain-containing protein n=1 Tax=Demequina litorisediminis TaxID=1849022 RepID=A0ABQ6IJJ9_9MICO|nr:hypothetical protein [Demequina litorisediminis]GMA36888.1 hypothetical protein GCM10025876_30920 [Demequina litorisediminis]
MNNTTKWALPVSAHATVGGSAAGAIELTEDGTFTAELNITDFAPDATGNYGIYTYSGSGAKNADFETYTPITFTEDEPEPVTPTVTVSKTEDLDGEGETVTITGTGFLPAEDGSTNGTRPRWQASSQAPTSHSESTPTPGSPPRTPPQAPA